MVTVDVTGVAEVKKMFNKLSEEVGVKVSRDALRASAKIIQKEAKDRFNTNWNNRTGNLEASIQVVKRRVVDGEKLTKYTPVYSVMSKRLYRTKTYTDSNGNKTRVKGLVADGWYAGFLEYGTSKLAAKPFLLPAAESKKDEAYNLYKKQIVDKAKKIIAKG